MEDIRILLPLDGSPLSEEALAAVEHLHSQGVACSVELLRVVNPAAQIGTLVDPTNLARAEEKASGYLRKHARRLSALGVDVSSRVELGPPVQMILRRLSEGRFDYLCMATHGRSGLARAALGSVTDQVIRASSIPVMVVHPQPSARPEEPWPRQDSSAEELIGLFPRRDTVSLQATALLIQKGTAAVPVLTAALTNGDPAVRQYALRALGGIRAKESLPAVLERFDDDVFDVRWEAAEAIENFGQAGVEAVLAMLAHQPPDVRISLNALRVLEHAPMALHDLVKPVVVALRGSLSNLAAPLAASAALAKLEPVAR